MACSWDLLWASLVSWAWDLFRFTSTSFLDPLGLRDLARYYFWDDLRTFLSESLRRGNPEVEVEVLPSDSGEEEDGVSDLQANKENNLSAMNLK